MKYFHILSLVLILALVEVSAETSIHEEANANEEINNIQNQNNEGNEENDNDDSIHSNLGRRELWIGWSRLYYSSTSATLSWECKASTKYDICWKKASQWSVLIA